MTDKTIEKLDSLLNKYLELENQLELPEIIADQKKLIAINLELSNIEEIVILYRQYKENTIKKQETLSLLDSNDEELKILAKEEIKIIQDKLVNLEKDILLALIPTDENDKRNVIVEIRGAAGGDEANIFASDLFDMYYNYANNQGWKVEILEANKSLSGGFSQISFLIKGKQVYKKLKYESGIHRVQRVPVTESKGRVHTSTASVAVLPEADDVVIKIDPSDLRIDTYRASGAGGQHVNMTDSAVRITHIPTGIIATSQDGRSQHDNKDKAMHVLKAKVYEKELEKQLNVTKNMRSLAVGQGKRAEKIRTYNFPQNRVSDHRIGLTLNKLDQIIIGKLDDLINTLIAFDQQEQLENANK